MSRSKEPDAIGARGALLSHLRELRRSIDDLAGDIIRLERAEAPLRIRDLALAELGIGILITDPQRPDNPIIYCNPSFEKLTGYERDEILGRNCRFLQGEDRDQEPLDELREAIREGRQSRVVLRNYRKDGSLFWNELTVSPLRDAAGRVTHFVGTQNDVTARTEAEEALRKTEEQLRHSQKIEALGRLAGGIVHDFNNLLTVIIGHCDSILRGVEDGESQEAKIERVLAASRQAASLTGKLLAFSRKQVFDLKAVDLNRAVREIADMLRSMLGEAVGLELALSHGSLPVRADTNHHAQVLVNLAVNAREAMESGGTVTIRTDRVERRAAAEEEGDDVTSPARAWARLRVSDTGPGIPPATLPLVFDPFFTTKDDRSNSGLGLSIVYGIARQLGGEIRADSDHGHGATFEILLPLLADADVPVTGPSRAEWSADELRGSESVLVVEDQDLVRSLVCEVLRSHGYSVTEASSADAALSAMASAATTTSAAPGSSRVDLLVTDILLPGLSGPELTRRVRERFPGTRVLYISGLPAAGSADAMQPDAPFLEKPFSPADLLRAVREALEG